MNPGENLLQREDFVWALGVVSQLHRIPFDSQLLLRQFPPPYNLALLQQALKGLDLKINLKKLKLEQLPNAIDRGCKNFCVNN